MNNLLHNFVPMEVTIADETEVWRTRVAKGDAHAITMKNDSSHGFLAW